MCREMKVPLLRTNAWANFCFQRRAFIIASKYALGEFLQLSGQDNSITLPEIFTMITVMMVLQLASVVASVVNMRTYFLRYHIFPSQISNDKYCILQINLIKTSKFEERRKFFGKITTTFKRTLINAIRTLYNVLCCRIYFNYICMCALSLYLSILYR